MTDASRQAWLFGVLCCFVGAVSVHDAYLLFHTRDHILEHERNPIGLWLIEQGGGDVWLFMSVKLFTTALVCSFLVTLYQRRPRRALCVVAGVAAFQFVLLLYLTWGRS